MRYFVKSFFHGWVELSKEKFDAFVETIRKGSTAIPYDKKDAFVASKTAAFDEEPIVHGLKVFGVDGIASYTPISADRIEVYVEGEIFGIWDTERKTFVD